jgi:hypothetical protein
MMPSEKSIGGNVKRNPEALNYWRQQIEEMKASGLTRKAFCEKNQIKLSTLDYWRQKLSAPEEKNETGWIPIKIADDSSSGIEMRVGRITIAVKPGFDRTLLMELLQTISAPC